MGKSVRDKRRSSADLYSMLESFNRRYENLELHKMELKSGPSFDSSCYLHASCESLVSTITKIMGRHHSRIINLVVSMYPQKKEKFIDSIVLLDAIDSGDSGYMRDVGRIIDSFDQEVNKIDKVLMDTILQLKKVSGLEPFIVL